MPDSTLHLSTSFRNLCAQLVAEGCSVADVFTNPHWYCDYGDYPVNYISYRPNSNLISFLPKGKEHIVNEDGTWSMKNRQTCRPAKIISKLLREDRKNSFSEKDIACFTNMFLAKNRIEGVDFIITEDINLAYSGDLFKGIGSCMWDFNLHDFYAAFGCKALIAKDKNTGRFLGRALLWDNVRNEATGEVIKFQDRVYSDLIVQQMFYDWADTNGYYHRHVNNNTFGGKFINPDGDEIDDPFTVKPLNGRYPLIEYTVGNTRFAPNPANPYIDTFKHGNVHYSKLSNKPIDGFCVFNSSSGIFDESQITKIWANGYFVPYGNAARDLAGNWYDINKCAYDYAADRYRYGDKFLIRYDEPIDMGTLSSIIEAEKCYREANTPKDELCGEVPSDSCEGTRCEAIDLGAGIPVPCEEPVPEVQSASIHYDDLPIPEPVPVGPPVGLLVAA